MLKIVFCDGVFSPELSDDFSSENMSISKLSDTGDLHWAQNYYGNLENKGKALLVGPSSFEYCTATDGDFVM